MSSARRDCNILAYYARLDSERLHVWKRIVKLMKSDFEEESEPAAWCAHQLTLMFEDVNGTSRFDIFISRFFYLGYSIFKISCGDRNVSNGKYICMQLRMIKFTHG